MKDKEFGTRLKWLRNNMGLLQTELVEKVGLKISAIQSHEGGQWPNRNNIQKYLDFFQCNEVWFKTGHGEPYPSEGRAPEMAPIYKVEKKNELHVAAPEEGCAPHGGWKPRQVGEDYIYAGKVLEILAKKNVYSRALMANIDAFHSAIQTENELKNTQKTLKDQGLFIKKLEARIIALERKDGSAGGES